MKKNFLSFLFVLVLSTGIVKFAWAEELNVNLTIKNDGEIVYSESVILLPAGTISINDSSGNPHDTNASSVLSVVNTADASSEEFNISDLIYYDMFGAFYLKCIDISGNELCDDWQYKVDDASPEVGMDSKILSGGENILLYFGDENKEPEADPVVSEPETSSSGGGSSGSRKKSSKKIEPSPIVPSPSPIIPESIASSPSVNIEEKTKPVLLPTPPKQIKKTNEVAKQNTATVINSVPSAAPIPSPTETPKKSWWARFWDKIFSVF